jgi:hypothetical protein
VGNLILDALTAAPPRAAVQQTYSQLRIHACEVVNKTQVEPKEKTAALIVACKDPAACIAAIHAWSEIGRDAQAAIPTLKLLKQSTNDEVRAAATEAMEKIDK